LNLNNCESEREKCRGREITAALIKNCLSRKFLEATQISLLKLRVESALPCEQMEMTCEIPAPTCAFKSYQSDELPDKANYDPKLLLLDNAKQNVFEFKLSWGSEATAAVTLLHRYVCR
jgi:hypothetical protein